MQLARSRTYGALNAGIIAGLFGFDGISGVICYVIIFFLVSACLLYKMKFNVKEFFLS